ncbi:hypothetical protein QVD17_41618 [Tagetes erecta]|uniref:Uncharacterized protein n=1 Tax=Tagetes erecta TaxID=13708 RepID=A0AAD8NDU1_TARER|nr:hypothetical protein QVD17_41618 [Tagetes erecta]
MFCSVDELLQEQEPLGKDVVEYVFSILDVTDDNDVMIVEHFVTIMRGNENESVAAAVDVVEKVRGANAQLSYNEAKRIVIADLERILVLINMLEDESDDRILELLICYKLKEKRHDKDYQPADQHLRRDK